MRAKREMPTRVAVAFNRGRSPPWCAGADDVAVTSVGQAVI